jgi:ribosomal-protein-alanine N-acetyltransferase
MAAIHAAAFAGHGQVWSEGDLATLLARPTTHAVTQDDAGFALIQVIAPEAEVLTIAVDPSLQGQGKGRALLDATLALAADLGVESLFLEVAEDNAPARALYDRAGFTETGRRRGYYARPEAAPVDAILMACALSAENCGKPFKS